jgi:hypothetical protein
LLALINRSSDEDDGSDAGPRLVDAPPPRPQQGSAKKSPPGKKR